MKRVWLWAAALTAAAAAAYSAKDGTNSMEVRSRVELFRGSGQWSEVRATYPFDPARSALIVCDMWDRHWCSGANVRVAALVKRLEPILETARRHGMIVVHAPSETMAFYAQAPQRQRMLSLAAVTPPKELNLTSPPLPIDDSGGGCDTPGEKEHRAWTCEHPGLTIAPDDFISDNGQEIYNLLRSRGIETVFYTGVHANMCILNRTFAIKQMTRWGVRCVLLRDLTDAMYSPRDSPYVSHEQGTELVIEYIEKYWSPTALSEDLKRALE
ncbi:MAG TPA: isochorismatase [Bryobacteraceae bacterium]|jgi:nicotinamidase-related amidase|nr:isochorismatase [Bryobacteraceae bacterium]